MPVVTHLRGDRLNPEAAAALHLDLHDAWRVAGPARDILWWDGELGASDYSAELHGQVVGPVKEDGPEANLQDGLYRVLYLPALAGWIARFHAPSGERHEMSVELIRIARDSTSVLEWRMSAGAWGSPPKLTISAEGDRSDWLGELPTLARIALRLFRSLSRRGRPIGSRVRNPAEVTEAQERLTTQHGRPPTAEEMAEDLGVDVSTFRRWLRDL